MNNVLIKYLSDDPLQNIISPLNYQFDEIIYFAYQKNINKLNNFKDKSLKFANKVKTICGISKGVKYYPLDNKKIKTIKESFKDFNYLDNNYYIDLTGCEGIIGVAFIEASKLYDIPAFLYDINLDREFYIFKSSKISLNNLVKRKVDISIADYINFSGGIIREKQSKSFKSDRDLNDFNKIVKIKNNYKDKWSYFSNIMSRIQNQKSLDVCNKDICDILFEYKELIKPEIFWQIIGELSNSGIIVNLILGDEISFSFKNDDIKYLLIDSGSIFEVQTFLKIKQNHQKCLIGVHLDWDGVILSNTDEDVLNEIDIIYLDGYTLTFVSCKDCLKFDKKSLYELEAVASRFGGKFCKMLLACTCELKKSEIERARCMGIDIETSFRHA